MLLLIRSLFYRDDREVMAEWDALGKVVFWVFMVSIVASMV